MRTPKTLSIPAQEPRRLALLHPHQIPKDMPTALWDINNVRLGGKAGPLLQLALARPEDIWLEERLPDQPQWTVAARVIGDERGVPVIAEMRLFPTPTGRDKWRAPGEWSAEYLGTRARPVPRGGVSSTLVRRSVALSAQRLGRQSGGYKFLTSAIPVTSAQLGFTEELLRHAGISQLARPVVAHRSTTGRRGRPTKWTPARLADIALTFDDAVRRGDPPIKAIQEAHSVTAMMARHLVSKARGLKLLRAARKQGAREWIQLTDAERARVVEQQKATGDEKGARNGKATRTRRR